jgi:hypothetical protein
LQIFSAAIKAKVFLGENISFAFQKKILHLQQTKPVMRMRVQAKCKFLTEKKLESAFILIEIIFLLHLKEEKSFFC